MSRFARACLACFLIAGLAAGCMGPEGDTQAEKRQAAQQMRVDTLDALYEVEPAAREVIGSAVGYATFSNIGIYLFLLSTGSGWGVVHDNGTGQDTYMKMYSAGVGPGLGVKDYRGVFVFTKKWALESFIEDGWEANAQVDAAAKVENNGGAWAGAFDVAPGIKLYQLVQSGLALQATIQGTKFWRDDDLS